MTTTRAFAIRIHGRGGQGVVTAAELLSVAAYHGGRYAQAFPSFGSERTGAPVVAFCRIDDRPIRSHEPIAAPDVVMVQDPTLLHALNVCEGLLPNGFALVNSQRSPQALGLAPLLARRPGITLRTVPATEIARRHLGRPLPNTAMLGALAALTGAVALAPLLDAIRDRFPGSVGEANAAAAAEAFAWMGSGTNRPATTVEATC
jgi:pyruvate ferredoxin oxidoreductase gamma subunit